MPRGRSGASGATRDPATHLDHARAHAPNAPSNIAPAQDLDSGGAKNAATRNFLCGALGAVSLLHACIYPPHVHDALGVMIMAFTACGGKRIYVDHNPRMTTMFTVS